MAALTIQQSSLAGLTPAYAAASVGGDTITNDGKVVLHVKNGGATSINVTVVSTAPARPGLAPASNVVAVPAGGERIIGPLDASAFNDANGAVSITYSGTTTVTVAAIRTA